MMFNTFRFGRSSSTDGLSWGILLQYTMDTSPPGFRMKSPPIYSAKQGKMIAINLRRGGGGEGKYVRERTVKRDERNSLE